MFSRIRKLGKNILGSSVYLAMSLFELVVWLRKLWIWLLWSIAVILLMLVLQPSGNGSGLILFLLALTDLMTIFFSVVMLPMKLLLCKKDQENQDVIVSTKDAFLTTLTLLSVVIELIFIWNIVFVSMNQWWMYGLVALFLLQARYLLKKH